jgi:uncharacterized protein YehS (DUF1456 family)
LGVWGWGFGAQPQPPTPQSPIPNPHFFIKNNIILSKLYLSINLNYKNITFIIQKKWIQILDIE